MNFQLLVPPSALHLHTFTYLRFAGGTGTKARVGIPGPPSSLDVGSDALLAEVAGYVNVLGWPLCVFVLIHDDIQLCSFIPEAQTV